MEDYRGGYCSSKRSGQIPVFGDWECADELPITQYFENARQAGLLNRYSSSSGECGGGGSDERSGDGDGRHGLRRLGHADTGRKVQTRPTDYQKHRRCPQVMGSDSDLPPKKPSVRRSTTHHATTTARPRHLNRHVNRYYSDDDNDNDNDNDNDDAVSTYPHPTLRVVRATKGTAKPVDEDLYKIPPELLHTTKRKKMLGFFSRCLVPGCAA